jgi:glycosyltransferase involved in cell wall biosynthesis
MKILVLFEYANHYQTVDDLCNNLVKKGVEASSFNITYWRFRNGTGKHKPLWISLLAILASLPGIRGLVTGRFHSRALQDLSEAYDIIDIHFFSPAYDRFIREAKKRGKKVKITLWGSDFYKSDPTRREQQREAYQLVDIIQTETRQVADDFIAVYPEFADRIRTAHFGIQFEVIDALLRSGNQEYYRQELGIPPERTILTCGTNGSEGHQHIRMLESIEKLAPGLREQLYLIIPMMYGGDKAYIERVRAKAEEVGTPFMILTSFLTIREMCKYRIASDITMTIQVTDSLSSAIQEHIYTGEILMAGDWLPYEVLNDYQVYYLTASLDSLDDVLADSIQNLASYLEKCSGNRERISNFSSWDHALTDWLNIYNEMVI